MRIDISDRHCQVSEVRRAYIARRLQFALSRAEPHIIRVAVFLTDLNGPRGGPDKQCRMVANLRHGRKVVVADIDTDLRVVIDQTASRLGRSVMRELARRREHGVYLPKTLSTPTPQGGSQAQHASPQPAQPVARAEGSQGVT
jgi:ribosome-associated translation inhibitor RaiA